MEEEKEWDGITERRRPQPDGREGRRPGDVHCHEHTLLWTHHEEDKKTYRGITCGKIADIKSNLVTEVDKLEKMDSVLLTKVDDIRNAIIGKYWFHVVVGFLCVSIAALGIQQNWAFKEIIQNQREFAVTINNVENKQVEMAYKLLSIEMEHGTLKQRQDILRDRDLKHMDEFHKKGP